MKKVLVLQGRKTLENLLQSLDHYIRTLHKVKGEGS